MENKNSAINISEPYATEKKVIDQLLNNHSGNYTDKEVIILAIYIKTLEKSNAMVSTIDVKNAYDNKSVVNDSIQVYSNGAVIKLYQSNLGLGK